MLGPFPFDLRVDFAFPVKPHFFLGGGIVGSGVHLDHAYAFCATFSTGDVLYSPSKGSWIFSVSSHCHTSMMPIRLLNEKTMPIHNSFFFRSRQNRIMDDGGRHEGSTQPIIIKGEPEEWTDCLREPKHTVQDFQHNDMCARPTG